ncbi:Aspartyl-tRNA synthetase @ Aspartyl-tRNA(Asn) synthetase [hydrothermal vent metagenome]|uniref:Aspartyl-tRNA synthetase @ Aspartyl-tRNA(Asn) synthetase n=1 Tax=hydrothermal vent metagenome TaxID=652676 RepID=A0A3B0UNU2_9ZZZZ
MHRYRSHTCAELNLEHVGQEVRISGWVHRIRDHGGILFIDLRDHYGITQCVADPDSPAFAQVEVLRAESVIRIDGRLKARSDETINANLPTGHVEIYIDEVEILGAAKELPLPVFGEQEYPEDTRLRYRFIDLRRERIHNNIITRSKIIASLRSRMTKASFTEFNTPVLTASSPEGARDFLVPSRLHAGKFYALPQAPQMFKQLLMIAGFDRYFQIAPCFRDEDPRHDRAGEFYQCDVEMSFVEQQDIFAVFEPVMIGIFEEFARGKRVTTTMARIPYAEAMAKYGTDKPDLRNPIVMEDVSEHFAGSGFKIFAGQLAADPKVQVWAVPASGGGSRAFCDRMNSWAQKEGQPGLGYIFFRNGEGAGPVAKNIGAERTAAIREQLGLGDGDAVFFICGVPEKFAAFAASARTKIGSDLKLVDEDQFALCWIVDFPMFEWDEEEKRLDFSHNPFSMPQGGLEALENQDPLTIKAYQYDIVCNGYELASGAIRNHQPEIMRKAFNMAGYSNEELEAQFGGMLRALEYGAPPHGGLAAGVERIVMLICGEHNLREVTAFAMNQQGEDLLLGAPSVANASQLRELHIRPNPPKNDS